MALSIAPRWPLLLCTHGEVLEAQGRVEHALARYSMAHAMQGNFRRSKVLACLLADRTGHHRVFFENAWGLQGSTLGWIWPLRRLLAHTASYGVGELAVPDCLNWISARKQNSLLLFNDIMWAMPHYRHTGWPTQSLGDREDRCLRELTHILGSDQPVDWQRFDEFLQLGRSSQVNPLHEELWRFFSVVRQQPQAAAQHMQNYIDTLAEEGRTDVYISVYEEWPAVLRPMDQLSLPLPWDPDFMSAIPWRDLELSADTAAQLQQVWREQAEYLLAQAQEQQMDLVIEMPDADSLRSFLDDLQVDAPAEPTPSRKKFISQFPSIDRGWDFPPQVYKDRKARQRKEKAKANGNAEDQVPAPTAP